MSTAWKPESARDHRELSPSRVTQARLLAERGQSAEARELFESSLTRVTTALGSPDLAVSGEASSTYFMCQVVRARVLKLFAAFETSQGDAASAQARLREVRRLESTYGFFAQ